MFDAASLLDLLIFCSYITVRFFIRLYSTEEEASRRVSEKRKEGIINRQEGSQDFRKPAREKSRVGIKAKPR